MVSSLFITAVIIILSILSNKLSHKVGIPSLLLFMGLVLFFGSDGFVKIPFYDFELAETICSVSLIFIIFYGGFGTRWKAAKPVAAQAILLSVFGVIFTACFVAVFCFYALNIDFKESFLIGSVISSTDAASVFSILRSKNLALKYNTSSMLELESGSNDPAAYMLTIIALQLMSNELSVKSVIFTVTGQFLIGILFALLLSYIAMKVYRNFNLETNGLENIFMVAMILLSFALPVIFGGNGYLSSYIFGIILGNQYIKGKRILINFFDGLTGLMQILIFFLLGLLAFPSMFSGILFTAFLIALFLTFVARPLSVFMILKPMKCSASQIALVSWSGLRGASSIVFAIIATVSPAYLKNDIFHIVFCIVLFSIALQGTLLPYAAKKLSMIDEDSDILKTFTDYQLENEIQFIRLYISDKHPWKSLMIKNIVLPPQILIVSIIENDKMKVPNGDTIIRENNILILAAPGFHDYRNTQLNEIEISPDHEWMSKKIKDINIYPNTIIVMIRRDETAIVPDGDTIIKENDIAVLLKKD